MAVQSRLRKLQLDNPAMPINELRSITIFVKIAELGSLRKAAEAQNMTPQAASAFIYYGSRAAQPLRVRAFIDLAVKRLAGNRELLLAAEELAAAGVLAAPAQGLTLPGDDP